MKPPCKDCPNRPENSGCGNHANCETYMEYYRANAEKRRKATLQKEAGYVLIDSTLKTMKRNGKK